MNCNRCDWCGELFWSDDSGQGMCPSCQERPSEEQSREQAIERELRYIRKVNQPKGGGDAGR